MCGIWGVSLKANANRKSALQKSKILGLYNMDRGKDSCGLFINNEIKKGIGIDSRFSNFIENNIIEIPKKNGILLGHTRQGSHGYKKTIEEAHPFIINNNTIFTHNGTIKNTKELCDKYRLIESEFSVDSQILGTIIDENGTGVLDEYEGAAAIAYTKLNEENTLYLFHGESKNYKHGNLIEERPLFYLECKEGIYYSSLKESLEAIKEDEKEVVHTLKHNNVYKIKYGKFIFEDTVPIFREEANVTIVYSTPVATTNHSRSNIVMSSNFVKDLNYIRKESLPLKVLESKKGDNFVYYHFGRFWEMPRKLVHGPIYLKKGGLIGAFEDNSSELMFFWKGVMLKNKVNYTELLKLSEDTSYRNFVSYSNEYNFAMHLSKHSKYPITNIGTEADNIGSLYKLAWYKDGENCKTDNYTPKFSNGRNYKIIDGYLTNISASQREIPILEDTNDVMAQIRILLQGKIGERISGGNSQIVPFSKTTSEKEDENDELIWFFDVIITSKEALTNLIGDLELKAMREFISSTYKTDMNLTILEKEIDIQIEEMFEKAIKMRCSLIETIDDLFNRQVFEDIYAETLKNNNPEQFMQSTIPFKETEEEMSKEEINELLELSINDVEQLQVTSLELMDAQESDLAQKCANVLITNVLNTLKSLEEIFDEYKEIDFSKRVKKIRETKSMKDGVL